MSLSEKVHLGRFNPKIKDWERYYMEKNVKESIKELKQEICSCMSAGDVANVIDKVFGDKLTKGSNEEEGK